MNVVPLPSWLCDADLAALDLGQFLDQRQTDAHALVLALGRTVRLPETVEDEGQVLRRDPHAGIGHAEDKFVRRAFRRAIPLARRRA